MNTIASIIFSAFTMTTQTGINPASSDNRSMNFNDDYNVIEIPITTEKTTKNKSGSRSITIEVVAFYYLLESEVEVNCFNIGITNVTLYGPMGIPVDTYTFDSNSEPMVVLSVPSDSGTYRIVIDADKYSGEGEFEVR